MWTVDCQGIQAELEFTYKQGKPPELHLRPESPLSPYNMSDNDRSPSPSATDKELVELANKMAELSGVNVRRERRRSTKSASEERQRSGQRKRWSAFGRRRRLQRRRKARRGRRGVRAEAG